MTKTISRKAKYQKLADMLLRQIELGQLDPGQKLPLFAIWRIRCR